MQAQSSAFESGFEILRVSVFAGYSKSRIHEIQQVPPGSSSACLLTFKTALVVHKRFIMISLTNINFAPHSTESPRSRSSGQLNVNTEP